MHKGFATLGYIALFILGLTLLLFPLGMRAADYQKAKVVVHKLVFDDGGHCSGTAVGPHVIFTVAHCVSPVTTLQLDPDNKKPELSSVLSKFLGVDNDVDDGESGPTVVNVWLDNSDHALLFLSGVTFKDYASFAGRLPDLGENLFVIGNPSDFNEVLRKGYFSGTRDDEPKYMLELNGYFGDSGAAIFDDKGQILSAISVVAPRSQDGVAFKLMGFYPIKFSAEQLKQAREWKQ